MNYSTLNTLLVIVCILQTFCSYCQASPWNTSGRNRNNNNNGSRFRIKGVSRGMLEISNNGNLLFSEWDSSANQANRNVWFTFCFAGQPINEIGHVSVMEICKAGSPNKKIVYHSSGRHLYVREPEAGDVAMEAVIYEHQHFFLRPATHRRQLMVGELEGSFGSSTTSTRPEILSHLEIINPQHLTDIEDDNNRYARWEVRIDR